MLRDPLPPRKAALRLAADAGCGDSNYQDYDDRITAAAVDWLQERAAQQDDKPWVLFVSLVCPHFPLIARPEWYNLYPEDKVPWPAAVRRGRAADAPLHRRRCALPDLRPGFDDPKVRKAIAAYFGLVSFVDHNVGQLMEALDDNGLADTTRVIYTSDHGDNLGTRRLWGKSKMYEESAGVPMIMAGPEVPAGVVCREPVSLVDCFPTIVDCVGLPPHPGRSRPARRARCSTWCAGTAPEPHRPERVPRDRRGHRRLHDPQGQVQIRVLRRHAAAAVRPRRRPPRDARPGAGPRLSRARRRLRDGPAQGRRSRGRRCAGAQADQAAKIAELGGREAILARGSFGYSPVPGTKPVYN